VTDRTEALHPSSGIAQLSTSRGLRFQELVRCVASCSALDPIVMAFTLMIKRVNHPVSEAGSHCDDPSCALCAAAVVAQYPGSDDSLLEIYHQAYSEIELCLGALQQKKREKAAVA